MLLLLLLLLLISLCASVNKLKDISLSYPKKYSRERIGKTRNSSDAESSQSSGY